MNLREALAGAPPEVSRRDAETLALHVLGRDRAWLLAHPEAEISAANEAEFHRLVQRRAGREPLQYITRAQEFYGLDLHVTPAVLIPRPETEHLVETVLRWAEKQPRAELHVLDVGTGSGAVALALAAHLPHASVTALDISLPALEVARRNAERLGLAERVHFVPSDLLGSLGGKIAAGFRWDAIASNPPYIALPEAATLSPEVREYEPHRALFAGSDGMDIYHKLIPAAWAALRTGGLLAMEFGFGQRDAMAALFAQQARGSWLPVSFVADLQGIPRVVEAVRA